MTAWPTDDRRTLPFLTMRRRRPTAFTLTEVLIAVAIVVLLLLGVSQIFRVTSQTVSSGQAIGTSLRAHRSLQQMLSNDFLGYASPTKRNDPGWAGFNDAGSQEPLFTSGILPITRDNDSEPGNGYPLGQPLIVLANHRVSAFLNAAEAEADVDFNSPIDNPNPLDAVGRSNAVRSVDEFGPQPISRYTYGTRSWRIDSMSFFTGGSFTRNSADLGTSGSLTQTDNTFTTSVAWVWYGHLNLFNSGPTSTLNTRAGYAAPGDPLTLEGPATPNRNNLHASQWLLGRGQILIAPRTDHDGLDSTDTTVANAQGEPQVFSTVVSTGGSALQNRLQPLADRSPLVVFDEGSTVPGLEFSDHKYAYPPVSGQNLSLQFSNAEIAGIELGEFRDAVRTQFTSLNDRRNSIVGSVATPWASASNQPTLFGGLKRRFAANPFPAKPYTSDQMAQRSLILAEGCTTFIVEFAGDFMTQNPANGQPTGAVPDGVLDYVAVPRVAGTPNNTDEYVRETRWYGLPRDVDGIDGIPSSPASAVAGSPDVLPVSAVVGATQAFEVFVPPAAVGGNYIVPSDSITTPGAEHSSYVVAFGPQDFERDLPNQVLARCPRLIRVTAELRDPANATATPVTQEYVYPVRF